MEKKKEGIFVEERSDMRGNYLVATGCKEGGYREEMLKNSRIPGLLPVRGQDFDGMHELWYETGTKSSLSAKFRQNAPGREEIAQLVRRIEELAGKLEEYLLEPKEIGLKLSWIFEGEEGEYLFLYLPGYEEVSSGGVCGLLEELMEYVDYKNHRAVSFLYLLHAGSRQRTCETFALHGLCEEILKAAQAEEEARSEDDFFAEFEEEDAEGEKTSDRFGNRSRIKKIMGTGEQKREENRREDAGAKRQEKTEKNGNRSGKAAGEKAKKGTKREGKIQSLFRRFHGYIKGEPEGYEEYREYGEYEECEKGIYEKEISSGADTVLLAREEASETVLLTGNPETMLLQEEQCQLEPEEEGRESIRLTAYPFCIGKERECDYVLKEPVISRRHAKILKEGIHYYLIDTGSLNGTYLNGNRLAANEKAEIKNGDRIDFADICFIFTCCKS